MYELVLEVVGTDIRRSFTRKEIRVGRDPNCDLVFPTADYPMVSRSHLLIRLAAERYFVDDLVSSGGTFVNGERIQNAPISHGDVIQLGKDGPQLKVYIGISHRTDGQETPVRSRTISDEATTKFK